MNSTTPARLKASIPHWIGGRAAAGESGRVQDVTNPASGAVTGQGVCTHGTPMGDVLEYLQSLADDVMAFVALDVGDEAHATCVMFVAGVVQTLLVRDGVETHGLPQIRNLPAGPASQ